MIVLDASALLDLLLARHAAKAISREVLSADSLHAPHLADTEVLHALRRWVRRDELDPTRAEQAIDDLNDLPINRHPHAVLTGRVWELRDRFSAYDATYVALAEALTAKLVTTDSGLERGATRLVPVANLASEP